MIIYEFALFLLTILLLPKLLYQRIRYGKYKNFLRNRLGLDFPLIPKNQRPLIWIHAVSVGETKAIAPLAKMLRDSPLKPLLFITNITETGHQEALRSLPFADYHFYLPIDLSWIIRPAVRKIRPDIVILSETDLWYNFLDEAKRNGAKLFLVNGKISDRSARRLSFLPSFAKTLFTLFDYAFVQDRNYACSFEKLGLPQNKLTVTGNLKLDTLPPKEDPEFLKRFVGNSPILVAGSTHPREEEIVLDAYKTLIQEFPSLKLIVVPRHPERFDQVYSLLQKSGFRVMRYSSGEEPGAEICLIDQMGFLNQCYAKATIALVCGSFVEGIGGHNIFEPAYFKKPILFGPFMHNQKDFVALFAGQNAAIQTDADQLALHLKRLLKSPQECLERGEKGFTLLHKMQGATQKTCDLLISHCS